jgi:hypothetical protein
MESSHDASWPSGFVALMFGAVAPVLAPFCCHACIEACHNLDPRILCLFTDNLFGDSGTILNLRPHHIGREVNVVWPICEYVVVVEWGQQFSLPQENGDQLCLNGIPLPLWC